MIIVGPRISFAVIEGEDQGQPVAMPVDSIATIFNEVPNQQHVMFLRAVVQMGRNFEQTGYAL